ncbi:MAG: hypothetical protein OHK006_19270 [Thermodesulfovibrionales bacterium]
MLRTARIVFAVALCWMLAGAVLPTASDAFIPVLHEASSLPGQTAERVSAPALPVSRVVFSVAGEEYALAFSPAAGPFPALSIEEPVQPEKLREDAEKVRFVVYHQLSSEDISLGVGVSASPEYGSGIAVSVPEGSYIFVIRPSLRYIPEFALAAAGADGDSPIVLAMFNADSLKAAEQGEEAEEWTVADPLESWNRAMFSFNDKLYFWVLKPLAQGYSFLVPEWGRIRIRNIFNNALAPVRIINCLLQLKVQCATHELGRFLANSIGGIGGMFDVFEGNPEMKQKDEDFGQTLGSYGVGEGIYLVWPFLGPSTARDTLGIVADTFLNPLTYLMSPDTLMGLRAGRYFNNLSLDMETYEDLKASAVDPYIAMRDAYVQYRKAKIKE